jgi:hypothetical protein
MPAVLKYDQVYLYTRYASIDSANFRKFLKDNDIAFTELHYSVDAVSDALEPLNTWFEDGNGGRVRFTDMPIVIYDAVYWEADDNTDRYAKRWYAISSSKLPADFVSKAVKNS